MMKYLEMNIKSKTFLTKQYALRLETNTRKIKPNIFKYAREQQPMSIINKTIRDKYLISNSRYLPHLRLYICFKRETSVWGLRECPV